MGLRPVGLVQGFCVMQWGWYRAGSAYTRGMTPFSFGGDAPRGVYAESYSAPMAASSTPTSIASGARTTNSRGSKRRGRRASAPPTRAWSKRPASSRAHGVIGVVDTTRHLADMNVTEFHILGTAVVVEGGDAPPGGSPWTTYLAGQRLAKLVEAGYMPVSVVAALASVRVWAYCVTEMLMEGTLTRFGGGYLPVSEVEQLSRAHMAARSLAREHVRGQLGNDTLQGALIVANTQSLSQGDEVIECALRGTRVRRFKDFDAMPAARPTVRLS